MSVSRRELFKNIVVWSSLTGLGRVLGSEQNPSCLLTTPQGEGPYYPILDQFDKDTDLTILQGQTFLAEGQVIIINGEIRDSQCNLIEGALIEIWQACASGKYNHEDDPNPLPLDPNFQYWGKATSNAMGEFQFKTIIPGHYPVSPTRYRPPHIHFKANARGFLSLTTQMYFDPLSYSDPDLARTVDRLNREESVPKSLIVHFKPIDDTDLRTGHFPITLRRNT